MYFQFCVPIRPNQVLLYDYKHKVFIFDLLRGEILSEFRPGRQSRKIKNLELKQALHVKKREMVLFMSNAGKVLPFSYHAKTGGFKRLLNLADVDSEFVGCPMTEIVHEARVSECNFYSKGSQGIKKARAVLNPYYIKASYLQLEPIMRNLRFAKASRVLFDEVEQKALVFKRNCIFVCGFSDESELLLNKILVFRGFEEKKIDWNSLALFGKYGNRKLLFVTIEEKINHTFYGLESIL